MISNIGGLISRKEKKILLGFLRKIKIENWKKEEIKKNENIKFRNYKWKTSHFLKKKRKKKIFQ